MDRIASGGLLQGYGNVNQTTQEEVVFWYPFSLELAFHALRSSPTSILTQNREVPRLQYFLPVGSLFQV